jgi:predicted RNase H-like nuclease (RuvC/YqgF family)
MTADNLLYATNSIRSSVTSLKKKLSNLKVSVEHFDAELEKLDTKFDNLITQSEIYKNKLERELGREVRRLERELTLLKKGLPDAKPKASASGEELQIATTISILEAILRQVSAGAEDFRLISESFLFPAVIERVVRGDEEAYFLDEVPSSATVVVQRGREYVQWIRETCDTHLTDPLAWEEYSTQICDWWRNDALPLLYSSRDEQWDIDVPLSLQEMLLWRSSPADRPLHFSSIFDAYEIYKKNKDAVYESSGVRNFELKMFSFTAD